ncbi:hypothetical protein [Halopenitus persicus]|uniref:hypothetical protein n=1 Tax=Halopenitus persicus TaxID=1048396 RepID=UPI000B8660A4|nr:hypothetical protein [Halopenitus persicus]
MAERLATGEHVVVREWFIDEAWEQTIVNGGGYSECGEICTVPGELHGRDGEDVRRGVSDWKCGESKRAGLQAESVARQQTEFSEARVPSRTHYAAQIE